MCGLMCFCLSENFSNSQKFPGKRDFLVMVILTLFWIPLKCHLMRFCLSGNFSNSKKYPGKRKLLVMVILTLFWIPFGCGLMSFCLPGKFSNSKKYPGKRDFLVLVILRLVWIPLNCGLCASACLDVQHVPIAMITKFCNRKQSCCKVTYCPLVPAWATTIHKFQGFKAGFDKNDQFKQLIVDPGDLTTVCVFLRLLAVVF